MKYIVTIEPSGPASYCASSPDIPGCVATGVSAEEAFSRYKEALPYHLKSIQIGGGKIPLPETLVEVVEVDVPFVS